MTGVLALQGGYEAHRLMLTRLGEPAGLVRTPEDLSGVDRLILPGGESSVMYRLLKRFGLFDPLKNKINQGMPVFGTCAGLILLSDRVRGSDQPCLSAMDMTVERNAYGRQVESFEDTLIWENGRFPGLFIRAPKVVDWGKDVEILCEHDDSPVLLKQHNCLAASFHPELTGDDSIHNFFLQM